MNASRTPGSVSPLRVGATLVLAASLFWPSGLDGQEAELQRGQEVYDRWCASCHGFEGDGLGPAAGYMIPRPRDFTTGLYQIRTTPGGELPTDDDIMRIIDEGMPGTTMPGWENQLSRDDRRAVLEYIKAFYPPFETLGEPEPIDFPRAPRVSDDVLAEGRLFYDSIECWQCHGGQGRGDGGSAVEMEDDLGYPLRPADLTQNWRFNGGSSVEDIYQRIYTGLDGTPMPGHADLIDAGFMTEEQLWSVAHYVRSLSPDRAPRIREVIRVERREPGDVPTGVDDERWDEVDSFYIPMVAQIIISPRWFDPSVNALWVQGVHDGEELALRVRWSDPSQSPDPQWLEWQERILDVMEPREGDPVEPGPRPDRLALQFPPNIPEGTERPYFLMGDARSPVYLWQWQSDEDGVETAAARGMREIDPFPGRDVEVDARWEDGEWQVVFRTAFEADDPTNEVEFEDGTAIPIAFFAWDGDNGEDGTRGAISSWYFIHLEEETPPAVYIAPIVAALLTVGLGLFVIARAQKRERLAGEEAGPGDAGTQPERAAPAT